MTLTVIILGLVAFAIVKVRADDRANRPEHYAARRVARLARATRRPRIRGHRWRPDRSERNLGALKALVADLPDDQLAELSPTILGALAGYVAPAVWDRCLSLVPAPCDARVAVGSKVRRCQLGSGHAGPHRLS